MVTHKTKQHCNIMHMKFVFRHTNTRTRSLKPIIFQHKTNHERKQQETAHLTHSVFIMLYTTSEW